ncbi:MAG TPA: hypothetical protein VIY09_04195, partial [Rhizomicrobium sp.]
MLALRREKPERSLAKARELAEGGSGIEKDRNVVRSAVFANQSRPRRQLIGIAPMRDDTGAQR